MINPRSVRAHSEAASAAAGIARHGAEIVYFAVRPVNCVVNLASGKVGRTNDDAGIVEPNCLRIIATESPQFIYDAIIPQECVVHQVAWQAGYAYDFAPIVRAWHYDHLNV
jgi:hypothetical protein